MKCLINVCIFHIIRNGISAAIAFPKRTDCPKKIQVYLPHRLEGLKKSFLKDFIFETLKLRDFET